MQLMNDFRLSSGGGRSEVQTVTWTRVIMTCSHKGASAALRAPRPLTDCGISQVDDSGQQIEALISGTSPLFVATILCAGVGGGTAMFC